MATTAPPPAPYPIDLDVERPEGPRNRLTALVRIVLVVPVMIVLALLTGGSTDVDSPGLASGGVILLPTVLLLLFRHRYPRWWFDFNVNLYAFINRVLIYVLLLRDEYPSTEDRQALNLRIPYPDAQRDLSRWLPLVKWLLALPHLIILTFLTLAVIVVTLIAWVAILITGRYPDGLYGFTVGYLRWNARVYAYAFMLTTDRYPPFRLSP